MNMIFNH